MRLVSLLSIFTSWTFRHRSTAGDKPAYHAPCEIVNLLKPLFPEPAGHDRGTVAGHANDHDGPFSLIRLVGPQVPQETGMTLSPVDVEPVEFPSRSGVQEQDVCAAFQPNVAKVEDAPGPRRPTMRLYYGTPNRWQRRRWGILGFPNG